MKTVKLLAVIFGLLPALSMGGDRIKNAAMSAGYTACLETLASLEKIFTDNNNYGTLTLHAREHTNEQIFNATIELTYSDGAELVDLTVAPTKDQLCSYAYTRTWYTEKNCTQAVAGSAMSGATYQSSVNKYTEIFEGENGVRFLLTPAGDGCMIQQKQVGFGHGQQQL